uniref:Uncharacterized protein n=1 Tax=Moniliophthora roreri TaxID=221103 RepID=A0A0W0EX41_MONRR
MATIQDAHAFTMNTRDVNHVGGDMHTHYHSHSHTARPPQLHLSIYPEADSWDAPTRMTYQPPIIPSSTDPSLPSSLRYSLLMFQEKRGYPLWFPEPNTQLPSEYKEEGLRIGDVGIVHHDEPFDFLFNITYPADHPINYRGVPPGFTQLLPQDLEINQVAGYRANDSHAARPIDAFSKDRVPDEELGLGINRSYQFIPRKREGALLVLPEGSSFATLKTKGDFLTYAKEHANEWFTYATKRRGRIFPSQSNPSLYLITGWEKCSSWGVSSLHIPPSTGRLDSVKLAFNAYCGGAYYNWGHVTQCDESRCHPTSMPNGFFGESRQNQSVFVRGFKISKRRRKEKVKVRDITATTVDAAKILDLPPGTSASGSSYHPSSTSISSSIHGYRYSSGGYTRATTLTHPEEEITIDDRSTQGRMTFHPCDVINHFLHEVTLNTGSECDIAISHDNDWISSLDEIAGSGAIPLNSSDFFIDLCRNLRLVIDNNVVYTKQISVVRPPELLLRALQQSSGNNIMVVLEKKVYHRDHSNPPASQIHATSVKSHGSEDRQQDQRDDSSARRKASKLHTNQTDTDPVMKSSTNEWIPNEGVNWIEQYIVGP